MASKTPVIIAANLCPAGVTTWAESLRTALAGHPCYEVQLLYIGAERPDGFDVFAATVQEAQQIVRDAAPVFLLPNNTWELYLAGFEPGVVCIGMCHADSDEDYFNPLTWYEPVIARFVGLSQECSLKLSTRMPYRTAEIATLPHDLEQPSFIERYAERFVKLLDEISPEHHQVDLYQRYGMLGHVHPLYKQRQIIVHQQEQLNKLQQGTIRGVFERGLRSIAKRAG